MWLFDLKWDTLVVVATVHDVLMTVGLFVLLNSFRWDALLRSIYRPNDSFYSDDCWILDQ